MPKKAGSHHIVPNPNGSWDVKKIEMKVIITGASGMLGQSVLKESLGDDKVSEILLILRSSLNLKHHKVKEIILKDFFEVDSILEELKGYDACFFCVGVSSISMRKELYHNITVEMTLKFAQSLLEVNPDISFTYISAHGANSAGKTIWAKVKGEAENRLLNIGFKTLHIFRPAYTHPEDGIEIKSSWNRRILFFTKRLYPLLKAIFPKHVTTTSSFGKAMLLASYKKLDKTYFEVPDINEITRV